LIPMDARAVRCILLGRTIEDFWAWTGEKHGNYLVKSAYRLLKEKASQEEHSQDKPSHSDAKNNKVWKKLWCCRVPPKVRVFWGRVFNEFIPSRASLHHRHIEPLDTCVTCGAQLETTYHALTTWSYICSLVLEVFDGIYEY
jgi:threonine/homoserine/homoserine lactone efflux protein